MAEGRHQPHNHDGRGALRALFQLDAQRALLAAFLGAASFALVDFALTLWAAEGFDLAAQVVIRLLFLELGLAAAFVFPVGAAALLAITAGVRALILASSREAAVSFPGLLGPMPVWPGGPERVVPWIWAVSASAASYVVSSAYLTYAFHQRFNAPELVALLLAGVQLALIALHTCIAYLLGTALWRRSQAVRAWLRRTSQSRTEVEARAAIHRVLPRGFRPLDLLILLPRSFVFVLLAGLVGVGLFVAERKLSAPVVPWRLVLAFGAFWAGVYAAGIIQAKRGGLFPPDRSSRGRALATTAASVAVLTAVSLFWLGAHPTTKYVAVTSSPPVDALIKVARAVTDFDRDGYGLLLGEGPPRRRDIAERPMNIGGSELPIPDELARDDYNFLLITVDTLRYDHTGFGGYKERSGRDTTPNLDEHVERAVSFDFAQAPSAGTMATIPALLTSRFFHSGIALDEDVQRGMPPRVTDANTLLAEVMKRGDYRTGAILTHYYFNDWGLEQGFDTYDNSLGQKPDPKSITSPEVTDKSIAWIRTHMDDRWFLWAHYLDPHGHYVPHDMIDYGDEEKDRYDGEIHFTDHHIGRLLSELERMPGGDRTVIIITSDHGEGFGEHGDINHGMSLYRELIHVPLIVYVPGLPPRRVDGPVSVIDIFPTMADIAQIDISDLALEGESLVPQLFYGEDARGRVVFAETNWPDPLRAIVSADYKLVYNLKNNFYELYDLTEDPWEKRNLAKGEPPALDEMRDQLDAWLERVYYNRDFEANQAMLHLQATLLQAPPSPTHPVRGVTLENGAIEVLGFDVGEEDARPGETLDIALYFAVHDVPQADYLFQVQGHDDRERTARSGLRITANGTFPSSRWRPGEFVRDELPVRLPRRLEGDSLTLALRVEARGDAPVELSGEPLGERADTVILGEIPLAAPSDEVQVEVKGR
jgi:arylsulfatase A-like enzyme